MPALVACLVLAGISAGATLSAQEPPPAQATSYTSIQHFHFRPIVRIAQDYLLPAGETVREVQVVFGDVTIEGHVEHDVVVVMGSARVGPAGIIDGSLGVFGGSAAVDQGASIRRDLIVVGGTLTAPQAFSPGAFQLVVGSPWLGSILENVAPWLTRGLLWGRLIVPDIGWVWGIVGIFFLIYLALNTVFDRPVSACADLLGTRPLSMFMAGLLVLLLMVPIIALVAATVIGLLLVPFIVCALIVAWLVGKAAVARAIGRAVLRSDAPEGRATATLAFVIGFGLLTLAYMVPVVGFVTWALTTVLGFGAATTTFRAMLRRERPARPVPPAPPAPLPPDEGPRSELFAPAAAAVASIPTEPVPRHAFSEGLAKYPRAGFGDRVAAFALDCLLIAIAGAMLSDGRRDFDGDGLFLLVVLAYHIAFWAWRGTTLGGIIMNLRVIRTHGAELRPADAIVRGLASVFSLAALGIGCFWMLQDAERQMWHDKIAGTLVVKVPKELVLA